MDEVIPKKLDMRQVGQDMVDAGVTDEDAQSLSQKIFGSVLIDSSRDCWLLEHTIVPRSVLHEDLKPFFNSISDGEIAKLPEQFQSPDSERDEYAMKQGDTVLLQNCAKPTPMS